MDPRLLPGTCFCCVLVALCVQLGAVSGDGRFDTDDPTARALALQRCYNERYDPTPAVFEDFLRGFNTSLRLHEVFSSGRRSALPLTIFTGATLERLAALEAQCRSYPGPLAAAIYVPLMVVPQQQQQQQPQPGGRGAQAGAGTGALAPESEEALRRATAALRELLARLELPAAAPAAPAPPPPPPCALTALLLTERLADAALAGALPINSLRNAALLAAATPLAAMVDVDLAPSASLAAGVLAPGGGSAAEVLRGCEEGGAVWILPAWETHKRLGVADGTVAAEQAIQGDKAGLRRLVDGAQLHYFAKAAYSRGHAATNSSRWLGERAPYEVPYVINYEPWFIISRRRSPPYDVRFRGYGWNKVAQVALVAASNFTFRVHPAAWLVHRPHERSRGQDLYSGPAAGGAGGGGAAQEETRLWKGSRAPLSRLFHRRVSTLRHVIVRDMRRGTYRAALDPASERCRAELPWWGREGG